MHLKFELIPEDYVEFNYYCNWKRPERKRRRMLYAIAFVIIIAEILLLLCTSVDENAGSFGPLAGFLLIMIGTLRLFFTRPGMRWYTYLILKRDPNRFLIGPKEVELGELKVILRGNGVMSEISWPLFKSFRETKDYLYLFTNKVQAAIIPKRIFLLEQELYDLKFFIEQKLTLNQ